LFLSLFGFVLVFFFALILIKITANLLPFLS
jgi:hypothetical protein